MDRVLIPDTRQRLHAFIHLVDTLGKFYEVYFNRPLPPKFGALHSLFKLHCALCSLRYLTSFKQQLLTGLRWDPVDTAKLFLQWVVDVWFKEYIPIL